MPKLLAEGATRCCVLADSGYGVDTTFRQALDDMGLLYVAGETSAAVVWPVHGEDIDGSHRPNLWKGSIACQGVAQRTSTPPARAQPPHQETTAISAINSIPTTGIGDQAQHGPPKVASIYSWVGRWLPVLFNNSLR